MDGGQLHLEASRRAAVIRCFTEQLQIISAERTATLCNKCILLSAKDHCRRWGHWAIIFMYTSAMEQNTNIEMDVEVDLGFHNNNRYDEY